MADKKPADAPKPPVAGGGSEADERQALAAKSYAAALKTNHLPLRKKYLLKAIENDPNNAQYKKELQKVELEMQQGGGQ